MKRFITTSLLALACLFPATVCAQTKINPATQIKWPAGSSGCVYAPGSNTCVAGGIPYPSAGLAKSTGSAWTPPAFGDVVALWASGSCTAGYLKYDGTCSSPTGAGVQYNASNTAYQFLTDSKGVVATANATAASAASCNGTVCTITDTQTYSANQWIQFNANVAWAPTCLNWQVLQVSATGLSGSSFQVPQPATCSGSVSGAGGSVQDATYFFPIQTMQQPYFNGHGTLQFQSAYVSPGATTDTFITNYTALVHPYTKAVTGNPTFTFIMTGYNDVENCNSLSTIQGWYQTLWADLHADGNTVVQYGLPSGPLGAGSCWPAVTYPQLDQWLQGQNCSPGTSLTQCWDDFINTDTVMANFYTPQLFVASNQPHFNNAGNQLVAATTNNAMAAQGPGANYGTVQGTGYNWVGGITSYWSQNSGECYFDQYNVTGGGIGPVDLFCNTLITSSGTTYPYSYIFYSGEGNSVYKSVHTIAGAPFSYGGGVDVYSGHGGIGFNTNTCSTGGCTNPLGAITGPPTVLLSADQTYSNTLAVGVDHLGQVTGFERMAKAYFNGLLSTHVLGTDSNGLTQAAAAADIVDLFSACSGTQYLGADGACHTASGSGTVTSSGSPVSPNIAKFSTATNIVPAGFADIVTLWASGSCSSGYLRYDGTCSTPSGGATTAKVNGGSPISTLNITGAIPVTCSNTTASGSAQSCSTGLSITPTAGNCITYLTNTANTGALTLNVDSSSAYGVYKWGGSAAVVSGDIPANKPIPLCFDAANHWDASDIGNAPSGGGGSGNYVNITNGLTATGCTISGSAPYVCTVTGSSAASITFSSIPGTYLNLEIMLNGTATYAGTDDVLVQFNGDTGSNYDWTHVYSAVGVSPTVGASHGVTSEGVCVLGATGAFAGGGKFVIPQYSGTTFYKQANGLCGGGNGGSSYEFANNYSGAWHNTAAITSITFTLGAGNFSVGDTIVLYGLN